MNVKCNIGWNIVDGCYRLTQILSRIDTQRSARYTKLTGINLFGALFNKYTRSEIHVSTIIIQNVCPECCVRFLFKLPGNTHYILSNKVSIRRFEKKQRCFYYIIT